jgi:hypothetical protein
VDEKELTMTMLGLHTVAEVKDQIEEFEWRVHALNKALRSVPDTAAVTDSTLPKDWDDFLSRWTLAKYRAKALLLLAMGVHPGAPESVVPAEEVYHDILLASSLTYPLYTSTDLPGLQERIQKLVPVMTFPPRPARVAWDFDASAYKASDATAKAATQAGKAATSAVAESVATHPGYYALGAAALVGTVWGLRKLRVLP